MKKQRVTVYCGSAPGHRPIYMHNAQMLGRELAARGVGLVYGGANVGTMGAIADACMAAGGEVIGVIPTTLVEKEVAHHGVTKLHIVASMHDRKALMAELARGFIAMPGGAGTLEEIFEVWTWVQIGLHDKPCVLLNLEGFYDALLLQLDHMEKEGLLRPEVRRKLLVAKTPAEAVALATS